ncbi:hypothetical protein OPV22_024981 [Ensete ventricosum]|uniref:Kinesin motor domain-containing protein n=1 Tax=Ensete ventricosum TaxID=4639 RepID=A0AAV8QBF5_ENSVE|nr:hypothetical protein OPV22_024981 [Ensete ventricosum]
MGSIGSEKPAQWEKAEGGGTVGEEERILVSVRLRPLNAKELERNDTSDWECIDRTTVVFKSNLPDRSMHPIAYTFDRVFGSKCGTRDVYEEGAKEVALSVVSGINATIFAYGQTNSGKTYTMTGITEYSVADIYDHIKRHEEREFILKFSAMEIYNEEVRDLLSMDSSPLRLLDDPERGTIVEKLTEETLRDENHLKELLSTCEAQRQTGETSLNEMSSRSHQILRLTIESSARELLTRNGSSTLAAIVNFVDLAGSERASQAGARLKEGCHINRSLLTLGTVIRKLSKGRNGHIPFRDSKLTRILQSSLGGNARTAIICTMSPARSHIEQSRNTLLFASCAKQVVTNAQVNVVMSDKALVKHLQREVFRLESELRYPGSGSCSSHFEALRDKDAQIEKMEREIKELIQQRDLAQSQLKDLLTSVGDDQASRQWHELSQASVSHVRNMPEDVCSISGTSDISPRHSISSSMSTGTILQQTRDESFEASSNDFKDHYREVRCIEIHASGTNISGEFNLPFTEESDDLPSQTDLDKLEDTGPQSISHAYLRPDTEQPVNSITETIDDFIKTCLDDMSPWPTMPKIMTFRELPLTRSRSCRASLMTTPSSYWTEEAEQHDGRPPTNFLNEFPVSPGWIPRKISVPLNDIKNEAYSFEGSQNSEEPISSHVIEDQSIRIVPEEDITNVSNPFSGMVQMAQSQHQKELTDDQETRWAQVEEFEVEKTVKDVGVDSVLYSIESPSRWPLEFQRKQQEIIELWHACNVSLVHRTYFFLLFEGDPSDSFYLEVENRRLSFLRNTSLREHSNIIVAEDCRIVMSSSSLRYLRRERQMLYKQMQKKLSPEERITIYSKWRIALNTKQRRLQLAQLIWTKTDMPHVRESASLVAKLIGFQEQGEALKEMFGLSFIPQQTNHRSFSFTYRKSLLM